MLIHISRFVIFSISSVADFFGCAIERLIIYPMNECCQFLIDLMKFLSILAFVRYSMFNMLAVPGILKILLMSHISVVSSDLSIESFHCP